ncbi:MAG TPA: 2-oxo acid dehydrogenase subunit E2, partial [Bacteroidia bacterium]|nr:2-oxo acid dehydrogenase subunit E2 [Bacteroidia bacterium]
MFMVQLIMPKMGESVAEATILKWLKKEGDKIEADEPVLEIATDKVDSEVPSPAAGVLSKRLFEEGQVVKVGEVIAMIAAEGESTQTSAPVSQPP